MYPLSVRVVVQYQRTNNIAAKPTNQAGCSFQFATKKIAPPSLWRCQHNYVILQVKPLAFIHHCLLSSP